MVCKLDVVCVLCYGMYVMYGMYGIYGIYGMYDKVVCLVSIVCLEPVVLYTCLVQNPNISQAGRVGAHVGVAERGRARLYANRIVRLG